MCLDSVCIYKLLIYGTVWEIYKRNGASKDLEP